MMLPAGTSSPPKVLTPRRFACESRPLRELPPAFLCAMFVDSLRSDSDDLDFGVVLAVPHRLAIVLAPAHLENAYLLAASVPDHLRRHRGAADERRAHGERLAVGEQQHLVEDNLGPDVGGYLFYFQ